MLCWQDTFEYAWDRDPAVAPPGAWLSLDLVGNAAHCESHVALDAADVAWVPGVAARGTGMYCADLPPCFVTFAQWRGETGLKGPVQQPFTVPEPDALVWGLLALVVIGRRGR